MRVTCHAATDITIANKDLSFIHVTNVVRTNTFVTLAVLLSVNFVTDCRKTLQIRVLTYTLRSFRNLATVLQSIENADVK
jgi:hypothetical protein